MNLPFYKYHGTGNDFILIDNRDQTIRLSQVQIARLCDRHFGIGADGLIFLTKAAGFDFGMIYYNSDGQESTMCGNGGRCITAFAHTLNIISDSAHFLATDGNHEAIILNSMDSKYAIKLNMSIIGNIIPLDDGVFIHTGSPHFIRFIEDINTIDVFTEGRKIRHDLRFDPDGTNVDFVEIRPDRLIVRTYERGVENETLSCGTGVTASALAYFFRMSDTPDRLKTDILTTGGNLTVSCRIESNSFTDIWLEGMAELVFKGTAELS